MSENSLKYITIPWSILNRPEPAAAKLIFGAIRYHQQDKARCWPSVGTLASEAGLSRRQVTRAIQTLKAAKLLRVEMRHRRSSIYYLSEVHDDLYLRVDSATLAAPISPTAKLAWAYMFFRVGDHEQAWPRQKTIAADLGTSRPTISKAIDQLEAGGFLQVDHCNGGKNQVNRYRTTIRIFCESKRYTKIDSRVKKRRTEDNNVKDVKRKKVHEPLKILSKQTDRESLQLLYRVGVSQEAADRIVLERRTPLADIQQAVQNAAAKDVEQRARGNPFKIAGYVVRTLEGARKEVKTVKPSKLCRDKQAIVDKQNRPRQPRGRDWLEAQRKLLGVAS